MPNGDHIAETLVEQAHAAIARGDATETQQLIAVNHAEGIETRNAICREAQETRRYFTQWAGVRIFGHEFTPVELAIITGMAIGSNGITAAGFLAAGQI